MNHTTNNNAQSFTSTQEMIANLAKEALAFAEKQYGVSSPIWNSLHHQIETCLKHSSQDESQEDSPCTCDNLKRGN